MERDAAIHTLEVFLSGCHGQDVFARLLFDGGVKGLAVGESLTCNAAYDESGNLLTTNDEYGYVESKESVKTFYARFTGVKQTYIRQIKNGDSWQDLDNAEPGNDSIGKLNRYSCTDAVGSSISSTATVGTGYKFVGWYDSEGNKVSNDMLKNDGTTLSYTITGDATYYARFEDAYSLVVSKVDGDNKPAKRSQGIFLLAGS